MSQLFLVTVPLTLFNMPDIQERLMLHMFLVSRSHMHIVLWKSDLRNIFKLYENRHKHHTVIVWDVLSPLNLLCT